jgi:hypothetical protein
VVEVLRDYALIMEDLQIRPVTRAVGRVRLEQPQEKAFKIIGEPELRSNAPDDGSSISEIRISKDAFFELCIAFEELLNRCGVERSP